MSELLKPEEIENLPSVKRYIARHDMGVVNFAKDARAFDEVRNAGGCLSAAISAANEAAKAQLAADKEEEENIREDESKAIIRCIKDCIRIHPDWDMLRLLELLAFREETRQAIKRVKASKEANRE